MQTVTKPKWIANIALLEIEAELLSMLAPYSTLNLAYLPDRALDPVQDSQLCAVQRAHDQVLAFFSHHILGTNETMQGNLTASGTQSNNLALRIAGRNRPDKNGLLLTQLSHSSINEEAPSGTELIPLAISGCSAKNFAASEQAILDALESHNNIGAVVLTLGTTKFGTIEDMEITDRVLQVLKEKNIWLHVDAAWGMQNLLLAGDDSIHTQSFRTENAASIARVKKALQCANSITIDPHKMFGIIGLSCLYVAKDEMTTYQTSHARQDYFPSSRKLAGTTISALPLMVAKYELDRLQLSGLRDMAIRCHRVARTTAEFLKSEGFKIAPVKFATLSIDVTGDGHDYTKALLPEGIEPSKWNFAGREYLWLPVTYGVVESHRFNKSLQLVDTMIKVRDGR